ncbi:hypothetical protein GS908_01220 [Rhodococcus hoagii]|nr:hypothetical protein [Prescottella equi]
MIDTYPQFKSGGHRTARSKCQAWDVVASDWMDKSFELPVVDGKPLLLVPSSWARPSLLMSATRYYETKVLDYAQLERAVRLSTGKLVKTPKDQWMHEPGLGRGRVTNLSITRVRMKR